MDSFEVLTLFLGPDLSTMCGCLSYVEVVPGSTLSSASSVSSTSYPAGTAWPSFAYSVVASVVCTVVVASMAFFCSMTTYATSQIFLTSAGAFLLHLFLVSWVTRNLASTFLFCVVVFSSSTKSLACHSGGHVSNIINIASLMGMNWSFVHCYTNLFTP